MRRTCDLRRLYFAQRWAQPASWSRLTPGESIKTIRALGAQITDLAPYSLAITMVIGRIAHILSPTECTELLAICAGRDIDLHYQGFTWLLQRAVDRGSMSGICHPDQIVGAFVSAAKISQRATPPYELQLLPALLDPVVYRDVSNNHLVDLACTIRDGPEALYGHVALRLELGEFSVQEISKLLDRVNVEVVQMACCQALHRHLGELSFSELLGFLRQIGVSMTKPPPVILNALLQIALSENASALDSRQLLDYYLIIGDLGARGADIGWVADRVYEAQAAIGLVVLNGIASVSEDCDAQCFARLLQNLPLATDQCTFDCIQLKAFVLADEMRAEDATSVVAYVKGCSGEGLLIAYPALNKLKRRFFDVYHAGMIQWIEEEKGANGPPAFERILTSLLHFVKTLIGLPLLPSDLHALLVIQKTWVGACRADPALMNSWRCSTARTPLIEVLSSVNAVHHEVSTMLKD